MSLNEWTGIRRNDVCSKSLDDIIWRDYSQTAQVLYFVSFFGRDWEYNFRSRWVNLIVWKVVTGGGYYANIDKVRELRLLRTKTYSCLLRKIVLLLKVIFRVVLRNCGSLLAKVILRKKGGSLLCSKKGRLESASLFLPSTYIEIWNNSPYLLNIFAQHQS